jgi:hypothetical protein
MKFAMFGGVLLGLVTRLPKALIDKQEYLRPNAKLTIECCELTNALKPAFRHSKERL